MFALRQLSAILFPFDLIHSMVNNVPNLYKHRYVFIQDDKNIRHYYEHILSDQNLLTTARSQALSDDREETIWKLHGHPDRPDC